jgi:hypothetical protein
MDPVQVFWTGRAVYWEFCVFGPVLSSPAHGAPSESKYFRFYEVASN